MRKQDRTHIRTPAALEQRYRFGKNFTETKQAGAQAQKAAEQAQTAANDAASQLTNKLGRDEKEQVVDMVNTSGKAISAEFDQVDGEHRAQMKGGVIYVTSPEETMIGGDTNVSKVLLLVFTHKEKKFGLYAYGEYFPGDQGVYWEPSQAIHIEEITE